MMLGPIPRSKIREYASDVLGLTDEDHERFCSIISQIDGDYIKMISSKPDDGPPMRDIASASDPAGTRRVLQNLAKKPKRKTVKPDG